MRPYFENVLNEENIKFFSESALWHFNHGWLYNVWAVENGITKYCAGCMYVTMLGLGSGIIHFECIKGVHYSFFLASLRKGMKMLSSSLENIYTTVPKEKHKLIDVLIRFGFVYVDEIHFRGMEMFLLKFLPNENAIL